MAARLWKLPTPDFATDGVISGAGVLAMLSEARLLGRVIKAPPRSMATHSFSSIRMPSASRSEPWQSNCGCRAPHRCRRAALHVSARRLRGRACNHRGCVRDNLPSQHTEVIVEAMREFSGPLHCGPLRSACRSLRCRMVKPSKALGRFGRCTMLRRTCTLPAFAGLANRSPSPEALSRSSPASGASSRGAGS